MLNIKKVAILTILLFSVCNKDEPIAQSKETPCLFSNTSLVHFEITEKLAEINAKSKNVKVEIYEWPKELHEQLGKMEKYAFVTIPEESFSRLPLVISLHGGGLTFQNLSLTEQLAQDTPRGWHLAELADKQAVFLDPFIHEGWNEKTLNIMLDYVIENFCKIDVDHVYVIGYSRGGGGTYDWIRNSGDRFAAAAPCGFNSYRENHDFTKMLNLPIWTAAGSNDSDRAVKVYNMVNQLRILGNENIEHTVYQGANHYEGGKEVYNDVTLVNWILKF